MTSTPTPAKRSVSFGPADQAPMTSVSSYSVGQQPSPDLTPVNPNTSSASSTSIKSALKPGTERRKLPPKEQYQHRDPLLRRLRLADAYGNPVDLKREFGPDCKLVGFYFSSQWAGQPLKEYHRTISEFSRRHPHEFKVIYVSVDVDEQWYKAGVKDKPWVSMVWNDGSSLPSDRAEKNSSSSSLSHLDSTPELYNSEDFLLANEVDIDEALSHTDDAGEAYLRPFSRVHLAAKLNILAAPTLCVYHLGTKRMLDWNVRMGRLAPGRVDATWEKWKSGEGAGRFGFVDAFQSNPMVFIMAGLALIYFLFVRFGGEQYNIIRQAVEAVGAETPSTANVLSEAVSSGAGEVKEAAGHVAKSIGL